MPREMTIEVDTHFHETVLEYTVYYWI